MLSSNRSGGTKITEGNVKNSSGQNQELRSKIPDVFAKLDYHYYDYYYYYYYYYYTPVAK